MMSWFTQLLYFYRDVSKHDLSLDLYVYVVGRWLLLLYRHLMFA